MEELNQRYTNLKELFLENCSEDRKEQFNNLVKFMEEETEFLIAPASTKYHMNKEHGLLEHSVNVAENLIKLRNLLDKTIPLDSCILVGLFHDAGKAGMNGKPFYVPGIPTPKQKKYGYAASDKYSLNPEWKGWDHSDMSIQLLLPIIKMSKDEREAILHHDGQYIDKNKYYAHNECKLALLIHWADLWSTTNEEIYEY